MVTPFLNRRHGFAEVGYPHESLRSILAETHGVIVFHEQVIRVIAAVTGCSLDDADHVRRHLDSVADGPETPASPVSLRAAEAVGSSPAGERDLRAWFLSAAGRNGYSSAQAAAVWAEVSSFAAFGFCKSHAAAFALPTYLSAWMKAHYPAEFFAGLLAHDPGMYPLRLIVADARRFGIPILPIDVNRSDAVPRVERCPAVRPSGARHPEAKEEPGPGPVAGPTGEAPPRSSATKGVRLALSEVRDISEAEINSLLDARRDQPFDGLEDLWRRAPLSRPVLENLIHVGALDEIAGGRSRRELLWRAAGVADKKTRPGARGALAQRVGGPSRNERSRIPSSGSEEDRAAQLFFDLDEPIARSLPELPRYSPREQTEAELEVSGIDARHHLMDHFRSVVEELGCVPASGLARRRNDSLAWVAGVKVSTQTPAIRSGQRIIFLTLDDLTGPLDVTIFERVQPRCAHTVFHSWLLAVRGVVRKRGGASRIHRTDPNNVGVTVVAEEAFDLAQLASDRGDGLTLATALGRQRRLQSAAAGLRAGGSGPPSKLWHASGGSAGR
jgi:error-prone DNA polymerase